MHKHTRRPAVLLASTLLACTGLGGIAAAVAAEDAAALLDPAMVARNVCGPIPKRPTEMFKPGFQLAATASAPARVGEPRLDDRLGTLSFPVTATVAEAQRWFDQGLRLALAFNHTEARRAFKQAQAADPTCAMCYWGEALVLGPNINWPMTPDVVAPAFAAAAQAMALRERASPRERALIEAVAKRYSADPQAERAALDGSYADAMTSVAADHADDDTIQVLFAEALMNLQPWDYWQADKATPKGRTAEQVEALVLCQPSAVG